MEPCTNRRPGRQALLLSTAVLLAVAAGSACAQQGRQAPVPTAHPIDTLALRAHTRFLASDLLEGRATGSHGAAIAALYIESACRDLGLRPAGDRGYRQAVPLDEVVLSPDSTSLRIGDTPLALFHEFILTAGVPQALRGFRGRAVLLGSADGIRRSIGVLPSLAGAVAVVAGVVRTDVGDLLMERGAVGIVQVVDDPETFALYAASRGRHLTILRDSGTVSSFYPRIPSVVAGPAALRALATQPGAVVELSLHLERRPLAADNVACLAEGRAPERRDTVIVFTAHYDHLGYGPPDENGDSLYNGFSDNAAGVAMLLAIAEAVGRSDLALGYSSLFLFFTGEERGLLGSDHYVAQPLVPLERTRAVINLDAGAPPARPWSWRLAGGDNSALGALGRDVAAERGWSATTSPATPNSDYFPFARRGVPAVFIVPGPGPYEGLSADSSQALRRRWDRYHQPSDGYDEAFPFAGLQRYAEYALRLAEAVSGRR